MDYCEQKIKLDSDIIVMYRIGRIYRRVLIKYSAREGGWICSSTRFIRAYDSFGAWNTKWRWFGRIPLPLFRDLALVGVESRQRDRNGHAIWKVTVTAPAISATARLVRVSRSRAGRWWPSVEGEKRDLGTYRSASSAKGHALLRIRFACLIPPLSAYR